MIKSRPTLQSRPNRPRAARKKNSRCKENKKRILNSIADKIDKAREENNGRITHQFVEKIVLEFNPEFPWVTRDSINNHYRSKARKTVQQNEAVNGTATEGSDSITCHIVTSKTKNKGGRPKGSTIANQKQTTDSIVAVINEVTEQYVENKKEFR